MPDAHQTHDLTEGEHPAAGETFDVTVSGHYEVLEVPPRCRNPRPVPYEIETVVCVPVVREADAPLAIESVHSAAVETVIDAEARGRYRLYDGDLYVLDRLNYGDFRPIVAGSDDFRAQVTRSDRSARSVEEFAANAAHSYRHLIVIGGQVWKRDSEPRYVVQTFGFGGNHGGTGLFAATSDNPNIRASAYFRVDQFEQAREHAVEVAENRGDHASVPGLRAQEPDFRVLIPEAVRLVVPPAESQACRDARWELRMAAERYARLMGDAGGGEDEAWLELQAARVTVAELTGDISGQLLSRRPYEVGRTSLWD